MASQNKSKFRPNPGLKRMDQVREGLRPYHDTYRTEQTYGEWILRYLHDFGDTTYPHSSNSRSTITPGNHRDNPVALS